MNKLFKNTLRLILGAVLIGGVSFFVAQINFNLFETKADTENVSNRTYTQIYVPDAYGGKKILITYYTSGRQGTYNRCLYNNNGSASAAAITSISGQSTITGDYDSYLFTADYDWDNEGYFFKAPSGGYLYVSQNGSSYTLSISQSRSLFVFYKPSGSSDPEFYRIRCKDYSTGGQYLSISSDYSSFCIINSAPSYYSFKLYEAPVYTIDFDANGGSGTQSSITVDIGNSFTLPSSTFTAPSLFHKFNGWLDSAGVLHQPGETISYESTGTYTFKASWERAAATVSVNGGSQIQLTWSDDENQYKIENQTFSSGDLIGLYIDGNSVTWTDGTDTNLYNHRIKKPGSNLGLYFKIENDVIIGYASGSETEYSRQFVVNDVYVNTDYNTGKDPWEHYKLNLSLNSGDQIKLAYMYQNPYNVLNLEKHLEVDGYFSLSSGAIVCSNTGTYDLYLKSNDGGTNYTTVYIEFNGETKATNYATYFNETLSGICDPTGATVQTDLENAWSQTENTNLAYKYSLLNDLAKAFFLNSYTPTTGSAIAECLKQYDFIITKYKVGGLSEKITNFMGRTELQPKPVGPEPLNPNSKMNGFVILASVVGASAVFATGLFVAKKSFKKKEHKKEDK